MAVKLCSQELRVRLQARSEGGLLEKQAGRPVHTPSAQASKDKEMALEPYSLATE